MVDCGLPRRLMGRSPTAGTLEPLYVISLENDASYWLFQQPARGTIGFIRRFVSVVLARWWIYSRVIRHVRYRPPRRAIRAADRNGLLNKFPKSPVAE